MGVPAHYTYEIFMIRGNSKAYLFFGRFRLRGAEVMGFFSERELFTFAICYRPFVCRLSVVCNVRTPCSAG